MSEQLTLADVAKRIAYDRDTGALTWIARPSPNTPVGTKITCRKNNGYICVCINNKQYLAHRIAWLLATGRWPTQFIDHINRDKSDNRFVNLRECSKRQNAGNRKIARNNTSGIRGVTQTPHGTWKVQAAGPKRYLGSFKTKEEAIAVHDEAATKYFREFYCGQ